jgi:hypothetical protein
MKSPTFFGLLLVVLLGAAVAFIRPAQPVQVASTPFLGETGLDNPMVASDPSIHPARKCGFCMG